MNKMRLSAVNFIRKSRSKLFNNGVVYNEVGYNESAQLVSDITLNSFTKFFPEQMNLEGQWEVANSEITYPSMYQKATEENFMFFDKKF